MINHAQAQPSPPRKRVFFYVLVPVALLLAVGAYQHWHNHAQAVEAQQQQQNFVPRVRVEMAKRENAPVKLALPGQTEAFYTANLYPRATGYVVERTVDIGSRVHKGDLLLRIAAPDLDQQLLQAQAQINQNQAAVTQAQAQLQSAVANAKLAKTTNFRESTLASQGWETKQNADNASANFAVQTAGIANSQAGVAVAEANLKAQQANVDRLLALTAFEQIRAPFDGVVTARNVDTGDLLTQDSLGSTPMFSIAQDDVLRVAVYVPQSSAIGIRDGLEVEISVPEIPGIFFKGKVARTATALQTSSRSMLTEVDIPNLNGSLRPGLFVNVSFAVPRQAPAIIVPDEALVFNASNLQVVVVGAGGNVHFQKVSIYRDFGTVAELRDGLQGGEHLILSPPAELAEGRKVEVINQPPVQEEGEHTASR